MEKILIGENTFKVLMEALGQIEWRINFVDNSGEKRVQTVFAKNKLEAYKKFKNWIKDSRYNVRKVLSVE